MAWSNSTAPRWRYRIPRAFWFAALRPPLTRISTDRSNGIAGRFEPWRRVKAPEACAGTNSLRAGRTTVQARTERRMPIGFDDLVDDVMSGAPETIRVFLAFRMRCVGCPIACFHTVDDACREHGVDRDSFLNALRAVIAEIMA